MDERDFEAFVVARGTALVRTAYLLCGDHGLAEDLVQEALAKTASRLGSIREPKALEIYVRRAIYHEQVSRWRRRRVPEDVHAFDDSYDGRPALTVPSEAGAVDTRVMVREALRSIAPRQRAVLVLRFFEDLTEVETASVLGCSVSTVKSQTRKALAMLVKRCPDLGELSASGTDALT